MLHPNICSHTINLGGAYPSTHVYRCLVLGEGTMRAETVMKYSPLGFFITAAAAYQGARNHMPWLGLLFVLINMLVFLPFSPIRKERLYLTLAVGAAGFVVDSLLITAGVYRVGEQSRWLLAGFLCPEWILALWLNYGFALYVFKPFLSRTWWIPVVVGLVFSTLIYTNAGRMELITFPLAKTVSLGIIAVIYALFIPACNVIANKIIGGPHVVTQT